MRCGYDEQIGDYIDGTLPTDEAAALQAHAAGCAACATLVEDLRAIRATARVLEPLTPPAEAWERIAARMAAEPAARASWWPSFSFQSRPWQTALAAALVVAIAGGAVAAWMTLRQPQAPAGIAAPAPIVATLNDAQQDSQPDPAADAPVETQLKLAEANYTETIVGLEAIRKASGGALDADTADVVQANLTMIDEAIGQSRAALRTEPANQVAQDSLFEALQSKVTLLQDTIALINEMRKGNQEGTARIVSGMNQ